MGKQKGNPGVQNRHIYSRASYLYQAATCLAEQGYQSKYESSPDGIPTKGHTSAPSLDKESKAIRHMSRQVLSDMRAVSLKAQIRQASDLKQTVCKHCDTLLIEGKTCNSMIENLSKGGQKPWADILVVTCKTCGRAKRYPVSAPRQKRRPARSEKGAPNDDLKEIEKQGTGG
jgi:ribonuclease P protein subunit RPR2